MAQAVENPHTFGNPSWAGTIDISLGGEEDQFHFDMQCPGQRPHERRHDIKRNGHDTSVKGCPQQYHCNTCVRNFYPHPSRFFHTLFGQLKQLLKRGLVDRRASADFGVCRMCGKVVDCHQNAARNIASSHPDYDPPPVST